MHALQLDKHISNIPDSLVLRADVSKVRAVRTNLLPIKVSWGLGLRELPEEPMQLSGHG